MSSQPPLPAETPQGLQKTLDTYREITAAACGLLSKIVSTTTASMSIPVDILNEIDAVQCRFREQRRSEYREGVPANIRSLIEAPSAAETALNEPLFPGLIYSTKPSPVNDDGPVCGDCAHFKPDGDFWGSCHRDKPGDKRGKNMLVSHAVGSRRTAFSPCLDFKPKEKPKAPKTPWSLSDEILRQAEKWADDASMLQADAERYQDVCDVLEARGFPVSHERGQDAHEIIDKLLSWGKPKGDGLHDLRGNPLPVKIKDGSTVTAFLHRLVPENLSRLEALYWRTYHRLGKVWKEGPDEGPTPYAIQLAKRMNVIRSAVERIMEDMAKNNLVGKETTRWQTVKITINRREYEVFVIKGEAKLHHWANENIVRLEAP